MPREITTHKVNGCNEAIRVTAQDDPGRHGGANHLYYAEIDSAFGTEVVAFRFQNGPIAEVGTNGITHEVLLAILIDRLEAFQNGPYKCEENGSALYYLKRSLDLLKQRTLERTARGVEGTHQK